MLLSAWSTFTHRVVLAIRKDADDSVLGRVFDGSRAFGYATAGGNDTADLYDSAGDDIFYGRSSYAYLFSAGGYRYASNFENVTAHATVGNDTLDVDAIDYVFNMVGEWE